MNAYQAILNASSKRARENAKERAERVNCPNCNKTFSNEGTLTQHFKFRHKAKSDKKHQPKLRFPSTSSSSSRKSQVARASTPPRPKKKAKEKISYEISDETRFSSSLLQRAKMQIHRWLRINEEARPTELHNGLRRAVSRSELAQRSALVGNRGQIKNRLIESKPEDMDMSR